MKIKLNRPVIVRIIKVVLPIFLLALGIGGTWWLIVHKTAIDEAKVKKIKHEPPTVTVTTAKLETLRMDVASQGVVMPKVEIDLVLEVSGKVVKVHPNFAAGGYFRKGDMLLTIDPRDYEFAVTRANASVAEAYKELLREREEALQAETEWQALGSGKATDFVLHKPQLKEQEAKLAAAKADLAAAKLQLSRCRLSAPFDGWVRDKRVVAGQYLNAGEKIARLYAEDSAEVRLPIATDQLAMLKLPLADDADKIHPDVRLTARFGQQEQHWQGRIVRTSSDLDDKNALLYAIAEIPHAFNAHAGNNPLMPGVFVQATIAGIERYDLLSLPKKALFGGNQVYSVDKNNRLKLRTVELLRNEKDRIVVTKGVSQGEHIVISGVDLPIEGMRVKIKSENTPAQTAISAGLVE